MVQSKLPVRIIGIAAGLAAVSAVTQLTHIGYQSPQFGMWIDIVAVSWLVAYFMFGPRLALVVSLLGALVITLFAPDTWLGASMKWVATTPLWVVFAVWVRVLHKSPTQFKSIQFLIVPFLLGVVVRCLLVLPLNYYYAIPIWTGMTSSQAMSAIPWYIIVVFNVMQSVVDVGVAWMLVYMFRLYRFAPSKQISS